jgi:hypothetical protein
MLEEEGDLWTDLIERIWPRHEASGQLMMVTEAKLINRFYPVEFCALYKKRVQDFTGCVASQELNLISHLSRTIKNIVNNGKRHRQALKDVDINLARAWLSSRAGKAFSSGMQLTLRLDDLNTCSELVRVGEEVAESPPNGRDARNVLQEISRCVQGNVLYFMYCMKLDFTHITTRAILLVGNYLSLTLSGRLKVCKSQVAVRLFHNVSQLFITHIRFAVGFPCRNCLKVDLERGVLLEDKVIGAN